MNFLFIITFIIWFFIIKNIEKPKMKFNTLNDFIMKKMNEVNKNNYYELKYLEGLEFEKEQDVYAKIFDDKLEIGDSQRKIFLNFEKIEEVNYGIKEEDYEDVISNTLVKHTFLWSELAIFYFDSNDNIQEILFSDRNFTIENSKKIIKKSFFYCEYLGKILKNRITYREEN
ncbi:hypothetical protein [Leptotrichia sp. oral taxon 879]|uniref:hypothetical protein n=1 Tax=Leptotrichia sp. oral taxon 879 TaxID=1227267 RepID=UPI0003AE390A|nr:hypothetical protein [Leptotrichia sp. oral taxon 879]ERK55652.1 hypothetical protein HMPREF1552_00089 [Leptotrichia sp. oral taxon 879 str. F0557]